MRLLRSEFRRISPACLAVIAIGCGKDPPPLETWPVRGTVVDQAGRAINSGVVRLMTDADPHLITVGPINSQGEFVVRTQRQNFYYDGAVKGSYEAVVMTAKPGADGQPSPVQFRLPAPVVVKPQPNVLELTITH